MKARRLGDIGGLIKDTFDDWIDDKAPRLAAALSYYTLFSLSPILIIAIAMVGFIFGEEAARAQIVAQLQSLVGVEGGKAIERMLESASQPTTTVLATLIGLVTLLIGATGAFVELQDALNTVWEVRQKPGFSVKRLLRERVLSFGMILGIGFLLLVSLVISAALAALSAWLDSVMPGTLLIAQALNIVISFSITTLLFGMIYKVLPDVKLAWRDVLMGAVVTSCLFTLGKHLIGLYLGRGTVASAYGAAGSVVALLVWIYYSASIVLLGAEFTQVYAERYGKHIEPSDNAEYTPEYYEKLRARAQKGRAPTPGAPAPVNVPAPAAARETQGKKELRITPLPSAYRRRRLYYG